MLASVSHSRDRYAELVSLNRLVCRKYGFTYGSAYRQTVQTGETMLPPW